MRTKVRWLWFALLAAGLAGCSPASRQSLPEKMFDMENADQRREGIVTASRQSWGLKEPYLKAYSVLCRDEEPTVRSAAIVALGRAGDPTYLPQVVGGLDDPVDRVRMDAAEALGNLVGDSAVEPLALHAQRDRTTDVRARCARALRHYRGAKPVEGLLVCLNDDEFLVRHASRLALREMVGVDCEYDVAAWRKALEARPDVMAAPTSAPAP